MYRVILIIVFISFIGFCTAQVNFSPNWGKRALNPGSEENENNCRENVDTLMLIYKIIQNEAQKLMDCEKFSN
ncbi:hypertrehalosaemic prohormone [Anoplophora glabripennis]|uniref:hypertrehalosaemic prohormone n=1 Tax=Anoplophora glabripennis TaxID=217634 RepID=UPI0008758A46|nr:hypertrehalosaemic prohormone [Anoplophora glabripennis]